MLPKDFPKWQLVYYYFRKWEAEGVIEDICEELRTEVRLKHGKQSSPSLGL
jgi:putative transposase